MKSSPCLALPNQTAFKSIMQPPLDSLSFLSASILASRCVLSKKLLVEQMAQAKGIASLINSSIKHNFAISLRPAHLGIPAYQSEQQLYTEIIISYVALSASPSKSTCQKLQELFHRNILYPMLLIMQDEEGNQYFSAMPLRRSRAQKDAFVWEEEKITELKLDASHNTQEFLESLQAQMQSSHDLRELYLQWHCVIASMRLCSLPTTQHLGADWCIPYQLHESAAIAKQHYRAIKNLLDELSTSTSKLKHERQPNKRIEIANRCYNLKEDIKHLITITSGNSDSKYCEI